MGEENYSVTGIKPFKVLKDLEKMLELINQFPCSPSKIYIPKTRPYKISF